MDELVAPVAQKSGLPPEQARAATDAVLGSLKAKPPAPPAGRLDPPEAGSGSVGIAGNPGGPGGRFGDS